MLRACWIPLLLLPLHASAQDTLQRARAHYASGEAHYRTGEFGQALSEFKASLRLINRPSILLNIAQCHRQLQQPERALFFYKLYLSEWAKLNPGRSSPYQKEVEDLARKLETQLKGRPPPASRSSAGEQSPPAVQQPALVTPPATPPRASPFYKRWWFWTLIGAAIAGGVAGGVVASQSGESLPVFDPGTFR